MEMQNRRYETRGALHQQRPPRVAARSARSKSYLESLARCARSGTFRRSMLSFAGAAGGCASYGAGDCFSQLGVLLLGEHVDGNLLEGDASVRADDEKVATVQLAAGG